MPEQYQSMFAGVFAGKDLTSPIGGAVAQSMRGAPVSPNTSAALQRTMEDLRKKLGAVWTIDRKNVFEVNAIIADAYKAAYESAEKTYAEINAHIDREAAKKMPRLLKTTDEVKIKSLKLKKNPGWFDRRRIRKYDEAVAKFNAEKAKITGEYATPLATLGAQMQTMAVNRGLIPATTQNMFDAMRAKPDTDTVYRGTFDELMAGTQLAHTEKTEETDGGMINEVYRTKVDMRELYVKPGDMYMLGGSKMGVGKGLQMVELGMATLEDITALKDDHRILIANESAFRDQGAFIVSKLMGSDMIVPSRLGIDEAGGYASHMDVAPGMKGQACLKAASAEEAEALGERAEAVRDRCGETGASIPEIAAAPVVDLTSPSLQAQALQMSAIDFVCGQIDRHDRNFCVKRELVSHPDASKVGTSSAHAALPVGVRYKITGIDNDGAFPSTDVHSIEGFPPLRDSIPFVTPELGRQVYALDAKEVTWALKGVVDRGPAGEAVLQGVQRRIDELKKHVISVPLLKEDQLTPETAAQLQRGRNTPLKFLRDGMRYSQDDLAAAEAKVGIQHGAAPIAPAVAPTAAPATPAAPVPLPISPTL